MPDSVSRVNNLATLRTVSPNAWFTAVSLVINQHMNPPEVMLAGGARAKDGVRIAHEPLGAAVMQTN